MPQPPAGHSTNPQKKGRNATLSSGEGPEEGNPSRPKEGGGLSQG